ncbi:MAG: hypothetical protein JST92_11410, partial [Deltaproteobacteria bacterium]|nr:hypothetical protein [Deltaproteobacteria bacterium]
VVFGRAQPITFHATADNPAALTSLTLFVGGTQVATCPGNDTALHLDCEFVFAPQDQLAAIAQNQLTLKATGTDATNSLDATLVVNVTPPPNSTITTDFVSPVLTSTNPPFAVVGAGSALEVAVTSTQPVSKVVITDERQHTIAQFTALPYKANIDWGFAIGLGEHTLTVTATDSLGATATATRVLQIACIDDTGCPTNQRCCFQDGQCHDMVAHGADCDCAHPCQDDEGCFPGTCGASPQKCRPGCNPGNETTVPQDCADENGKPAYCSVLPPSQQTPQNHGGACAPSDGCSVVNQDCPDLPLDRTKPVSANNPAVPHTCEPVSPTRNSCFPAGTHAPQSNPSPSNHCKDGAEVCGNNVDGCTKGYICVGIDGHPEQGLACSKQCRNPYFGSGIPPTGGDCSNSEYCAGLIGNGRQHFNTGVCAPF